ncbi:MAG TPA: chromate efflux transporter [Anaerolineales bacterium]|nr:chromate efflux transporter [Anaerolineales bacterium]HMR98116.1 chromate efflux transporter [Anaerolineales bacterium]HNQ94387.1 chromate efflux transporter [Anaerolineales bacterium]HNS62039.1 chromate efflux transporter [Anaerolineales bacterium]
MTQEYSVPRESYSQLFLRFLKFGFLAWGGPVAQIAMIRQELVEEEKWISPERFNRVLGVYQILPGPEANELCVYFGMMSRGRLGGLLAGLGFMLPGFFLMFALSWFYVEYGINSVLFAGIFYGFQAAVPALIVRAVHRIGTHALRDKWLWAIGIASALATFLNVNFILVLVAGGIAYALAKQTTFANPMLLVLPISGVAVSFSAPTTLELLGYGFRTGLLTFGGAYTAIPFLQRDAVIVGAWMTNQQFLDGLALSSILPAPLIIFSTFVGYLGGGPLGALALTAGVFIPAFSFTLIGHDLFERLVENKQVHSLLDGVTAAVVGLIAVTAVRLFQTALPDFPAIGIFILALFALYRWKAKTAIAGVMLGAGLLGLIVRML